MPLVTVSVVVLIYFKLQAVYRKGEKKGMKVRNATRKQNFRQRKDAKVDLCQQGHSAVSLRHYVIELLQVGVRAYPGVHPASFGSDS